ncbi:hypothetical protein SAMN05421753_114126 [Planctomicrobium piriforme]|uniref:Uncharacterized protein n=1 Tax=Planctomicrobium piriforme TaxID=1576369 RepID=A0A1I3MVW3_9PLAN|nr:hypothetical protein SAMN05421753_114126 [Planctomicrobium piriforme]
MSGATSKPAPFSIRSLVQAGLAVFLCFVLLLIAAIVETAIRAQYARSIPVTIDGLEGVQVTARVMPDILWASEMWWIECDSAQDLLLKFDSGWVGRIPPAKSESIQITISTRQNSIQKPPATRRRSQSSSSLSLAQPHRPAAVRNYAQSTQNAAQWLSPDPQTQTLRRVGGR